MREAYLLLPPHLTTRFFCQKCIWRIYARFESIARSQPHPLRDSNKSSNAYACVRLQATEIELLRWFIPWLATVARLELSTRKHPSCWAGGAAARLAQQAA
eukprot:3155454-Pleurochrysis_carterae.AAC.1